MEVVNRWQGRPALTTNQDFRLSPPGAGAIHERVWHFHNAYSLLLPGDRHLAEDVSQEVFLRAFRYRTSFRGEQCEDVADEDRN